MDIQPFCAPIPGLYTRINDSAVLNWAHMSSANGRLEYGGTKTTVTLYTIRCVREQPRQAMALSSSLAQG